MIKVRKITGIGRDIVSALSAYAQDEWNLIYPHRETLYKISRRLWVLEVNDTPTCVIGLKFNTLLGTGAEFYFMLCRHFSKHAKALTRFIRKALRRLAHLYGSVTVKVDSEYWVGKKFVEFLGLRNCGKACETKTTTYDLYELRASWL